MSDAVQSGETNENPKSTIIYIKDGTGERISTDTHG